MLRHLLLIPPAQGLPDKEDASVKGNWCSEKRRDHIKSHHFFTADFQAPVGCAIPMGPYHLCFPTFIVASHHSMAAHWTSLFQFLPLWKGDKEDCQPHDWRRIKRVHNLMKRWCVNADCCQQREWGPGKIPPTTSAFTAVGDRELGCWFILFTGMP